MCLNSSNANESDDQWIKLKCGHCFHSECLEMYLDHNTKSKCPTCSQDFFSNSIVDLHKDIESQIINQTDIETNIIV